MSSPRWSAGERFERSASFEVNGRAAEVFPLLCPVREYEWLPDWRCTMQYSRSGVAEENAVFRTDHMFGAKPVVWCCITYEPDSFIEYLMVSGKDGVVRLSIRLKEAGEGKTLVTWGMIFTATSRTGRFVARRQFSDAAYAEMMKSRHELLDHFLRTGRMAVAAERSH